MSNPCRRGAKLRFQPFWLLVSITGVVSWRRPSPNRKTSGLLLTLRSSACSCLCSNRRLVIGGTIQAPYTNRKVGARHRFPCAWTRHPSNSSQKLEHRYTRGPVDRYATTTNTSATAPPACSCCLPRSKVGEKSRSPSGAPPYTAHVPVGRRPSCFSV